MGPAVVFVTRDTSIVDACVLEYTRHLMSCCLRLLHQIMKVCTRLDTPTLKLY